MARYKRYMVALSVLVVRRESLAILGCEKGECLNVLLLLRENSLWVYIWSKESFMGRISREKWS